MIVPCIDLMGGTAVQLVRGRKKALEADPFEMLRKFKGFPVIHIIDLDAAIGTGNNDKLVKQICRKAPCRVGGGVRSVERVRDLVELGAKQIIIGTAAFSDGMINHKFLRAARRAASKKRIIIALDTSKGKIVVKGWRTRTKLRAQDVMPELEPYCVGFLCTYVDKEGMMQGTNLRWFRSLRQVTRLPLIAAGGITTKQEVEALARLNIDAAVGMAIYTGKMALVQDCSA
ncbi:MAG: 1-(5-phosphoribosyl)-5-((5-phosphoribosylamino)methylideneamino)imidazole-4-carboxamide isomerase [Acidobacteria bacterium RIFCSPLOWO2_12_FULL_54_10]|nr:MAG: 1-(5-phosphoribosyl)-5-((5-phosphoribosylamino)methylideneamino)imidazole-4-carboxamide isomerase [Acidobacteria bacterium RIFCSPLOWO2_12_FULL_54_10]